ncbi:MAG: hypothetical protein JW940_07930 [Polyangiaceae bacterium]|nr:hypothetical protein [Polyangiaceae bacterium]
MPTAVQRYLARIGRRGGQRSRRTLSPEQARDMVRVREARRAYREFLTECFWYRDPDYRVTLDDIPWVAAGLMTHGGRRGWEIGASLLREGRGCR